MGVGARLSGVLMVAVIAMVLPSSAQAQGRLAPVSGKAIVSEFKPADGGQQAELAVSVRNDSGYDGALGARLVYDDGTSLQARGGAEPPSAGSRRLDWTEDSAPSAAPHDVTRVTLQAWVDARPEKALKGTLIVTAAEQTRIAPLAVPVTLSPPAEQPAIWHEARIKPPTVVVRVYRWLPLTIKPSLLITDAQGLAVENLAAGDKVEKGQTWTEPVAASDNAGRGHVTLEAPKGIDPAKKKGTLRADAKDITLHGEYEAEFKLAPDDEKSATVTVKVIAADLFIWPLLVLFAGAWIALKLLERSEQRRPRDVLALAIAKLDEAHTKDRTDGGGDGPYKLGAFESEQEEKTRDEPEATKLLARIEGAKRSEELDDIQKDIADLDARVRLWPVSRTKAKALEQARTTLPGVAAAKAMREASEKLGKRAKAPASETATKAYHEDLDAQVEAIETWVLAWTLLGAATELHERLTAAGEVDRETMRHHHPGRWSADLEVADGPDDLERCGVLDGLCRDLHLLRSLDLTRDEPPVRLGSGVLTIEGFTSVDELATALTERGADAAAVRGLVVAVQGTTEPTPKPELPSGPGRHDPSPSISAGLLADLEAADTLNFWWAFAITTLAYFVGIYGDTFGSWIEYLTAFAAGAGSTYVANYKLLPWFRSYRPPKPA